MKTKKTNASESYVFDTSALLTLWNDEEGADTVEDLLISGAQRLRFLYDLHGGPLPCLK
jgi:hypothetical protein